MAALGYWCNFKAIQATIGNESIPPTITLEQAHGFGMFTLKAVISGRGDELIDLAKVNFFR